MVLDFSIGVSASSGYDRQEADDCITISERLSVKGRSESISYKDYDNGYQFVKEGELWHAIR